MAVCNSVIFLHFCGKSWAMCNNRLELTKEKLREICAHVLLRNARNIKYFYYGLNST
jgi:hypothetical protein